MTSRASHDQAMLAVRAYRLGCRPKWHDGILGWAFHCTCPDNEHGVDQQCSAITEESLAAVEARAFFPVPRDGGWCCDPGALFGAWDGRSVPKGIDFVDTTFVVPEEPRPVRRSESRSPCRRQT